MLSERQEKILQILVKEYIGSAEPISSSFLKEKCSLDVSPATIRNELQELTQMGYITQPHTSAGRVPTEKGYKFFAVWIEHEHQNTIEDLVLERARRAREEIEKEMKAMEQFVETLADNDFFEILKMLDQWNKKIID